MSWGEFNSGLDAWGEREICVSPGGEMKLADELVPSPKKLPAVVEGAIEEAGQMIVRFGGE